jgi:hypothetical protein
MEVIARGKKERRVRERPSEDAGLPKLIEIDRKHGVERIVPGHVWRTKAFKWSPQTFATESEQLNSKFIESTVQDKSLAKFIENPCRSMIYGVGGNPDDAKAKYFAAYLVALHMQHLKGDANPVWATLYGGFDNHYLDKERAPPTLIVITNLTVNSTAFRIEKARDIIEAYPNVPRIVVCAGLDPMSFLATRLFCPVHGLAYFIDSIVKKKIDII